MKQSVINMLKIWLILILGGSLIFVTSNCSQDPLLEEVQGDALLKAMKKLPKYDPGYSLEFTKIINDDEIEISIPDTWNGVMLVYAHGYVDPIAPIEKPNDAVEGVPIKTLVTGLNFGYAATSYSENGFAVKEAVNDIKFLGNLIKAHYKPAKIILGGVSEGGLVALKMLEREDQDIFDAGLVTCAPIGNFQRQLQYFGDFHVLVNYLYAVELATVSLDLGSPGFVDPDLMEDWYSQDLTLITKLETVIGTNILKLPLLLSLADVPVYRDQIIINGSLNIPYIQYLKSVAIDILRFNIMATNDMIERVHGVPYDNTDKIYSCNTLLEDIGLDIEVFSEILSMINNEEWGVERITADKQALHRVELLYETSGSPNVPVKFLHTAVDHVTPYWHINEEFIYKANSNCIIDTPVDAVGHCNFEVTDITDALSSLLAP